MSTKYVMDNNNRNIGYTKDMGSVIYAHDKTGKNVGYYNPTSNTTFDRNGKRYGNGNLTESLVFEASKSSK
jgi:hypothetical protein